MSATRIVAVLGTRYQDLAIEEEILRPVGVRFLVGSGGTSAEVIEQAADAEVILAGSGPKFDATTLAELSCKAIVRYGVGTDSIDLDAAHALGIWVARVSDYGTEAVATHAVAMALSAIRRLREADLRVREGSWGFAPMRPLHLPSATTVGVLGAGRIGRHATRQFVGIGFRVITHDPIPPAENQPGVLPVSFDELIATSDVLSLHAPGEPGAAPLIDADVIDRLKPGSVLVNTARGTLIDEKALARGLAVGRPGYAALDVFHGEPPTLAVFDGVLDRLILSPHMAWYTEESERDMRVKAAEEARRLLLGEYPRDVVVDPTSKGMR